MKTWITDAHGNRCSIEYWGSKEAAQAALDSLKGCSHCSHCSGCSCCSGCSDCLLCSLCSRCSLCSDCSRCSRCSLCSDCSGCSGCKNSVVSVGSLPTTPAIPDIHKAVYAAVSQPGALNMQDWHTCETTHCRAGWVVALAGEPGRALEQFFNTPLAAMKIYEASGYKINPCRFFDRADEAMADMKRLAETT